MTTRSKPAEIAQNQVAREQGRPDVTDGRRLTQAEWAKVLPPFFHIRPEMKTWGTVEWEVAQKWMGKNATGWWYYNDKRFVFEKVDDAILLKMWAKDEPLAPGGITSV